MHRVSVGLCTLMIAGCIEMAFASSTVKTENTPLVVDVRQRAQVFEGWGTSLCWWADRVGDWPDDKLDPLLKLLADTNEGLGFTIYRYNIGGGDDPTHKHHRAGAAIPGFRPTKDGPYDWTADAKQRRVLDKLLKLTDKPILEAFSLSPPYWMTISGCTSGAVDGGSNIKPDYFDDYADYLTEVVKHFRDEKGIVFRTLSPMNEPNADWWKALTAQEGCHVSVPEQERLIQEVAKHLKRKGLKDTTVSAPETNSIDTCVSNFKAYSQTTIDALGQINTHSYYGEKHTELRDIAKKHKKRLWQSESGPLFYEGNALETQLFMSERIIRDIRELEPAAWVDWQFMAGLHWGCVDWLKEPHSFRIKKKLYFYKQFSRFIRPGDQILRLTQPHALAAISEQHQRVVIVLVNSDQAARKYRLKLAGLPSNDRIARLFRTSATEDFARQADLPVRGERLILTAKPQSVTTLVIAVGP